MLYWYTRTHTDAEEALVDEGKHLFALVMNRKAAAKTLKHISLYTNKKLLSKFESVKVLPSLLAVEVLQNSNYW